MRTSWIRCLSFACLATALVACQSDEQKLAEHMSRGDVYFENEEFAEAIIEYKSALQIDPNTAAAHWGLAQSYIEIQEPREGFWELRETVRLDPANLEARLRFGTVSLYAQEYDESLSQAEAVLAVEPENVRGHILKGQALEAQKEFRKATKSYAQAVELGPGSDDHAAALAVFASFRAKRGQREEAEPLYRKLLEVEPSFINHLLLAGFLTQDPESVAEAEEVYKQAIEVAEPEQLQRAHGSLAGYYFTNDRFDDAVRTLKEGIDSLDESLELVYLLARFYNSKGMNDEADALVNEATQHDPDDPGPYLILSTYLGRRNDQTGALEAAQKAVEIDPTNVEARLRTAELLVDIGFLESDTAKVDEGEAMVAAILTENAAHPTALVVRAKIDLARKDPKKAIASLHAALDNRPDWPKAHFLLGSALALQGDGTAARTELARAVELDPTLLEARKVLARIHHGLGEHQYALEEGRRYLEQVPDDVSTRIIVAQSLVNLGRRAEALRELEAVPEESRDHTLLFALGQLNLGLGRFAEARAAFEAAHAQRSRNSDVLRALLTLDLRENRVDESVARIEAAVRENPDNGRLQQLNGTVAMIQGRVDDAEASFKKAIEASPEDLSGYERLASFYARAGRSDEAIETFERAVRVQPERAEVYYMLGVLYELTDDTPTAIQRYEEAIRRGAGMAEAKNNLAYLYANSGENLDRALDLAQEAKALMPDNPNTADTLGWVLYKRGIPSAAINYLQEAESGFGDDPRSLGLVRHHLALAFEANEQPGEALATVERALSDVDAQIAEARANNRNPGPEPEWVADLRGMQSRLANASDAG